MDEAWLTEWATRIVAHAPDAVIVADRDGLIRIWNRGAERIFGHLAGEALGLSLDIVIPERLRQGHWKGFRHAVETGETRYGGRVLSTRSVRADGTTVYLDLSFALLTDESGGIVGVAAFARDATERFRAEKALRARVSDLEEQLRASGERA